MSILFRNRIIFFSERHELEMLFLVLTTVNCNLRTVIFCFEVILFFIGVKNLAEIAKNVLIYSLLEPVTDSKRYSVREKDSCRRKYFQHIEHQENQDDFRYKLSRSRVDSTGK